MKPNLIVLLADLFNLLEIHPAKCVSYPGMDQYGMLLDVALSSSDLTIVHTFSTIHNFFFQFF
jgi:hypothetical protein